MAHLGILKQNEVEEVVCEVFNPEKIKHKLKNLSFFALETGVVIGSGETQGKCCLLI